MTAVQESDLMPFGNLVALAVNTAAIEAKIAEIKASEIGDYGTSLLPDLNAYIRRIRNFTYALYSCREINEERQTRIYDLLSDLEALLHNNEELEQ